MSINNSMISLKRSWYCSIFIKRWFGHLIIAILLILNSSQVHAQWYSLKTNNLNLITYDKAHHFIREHMVRCFENSLRFHQNLFDYKPSEEVTIFLHDMNDYGSAGTNTIPWNFLSIGIEPFDYVYETSPTNERMNWVMNHELVHVLATDKATKVDNFFRTLFQGKVTPNAEVPLSMFYSFLTSPRWYSPRWYHEGIAVFMETWMAGGIGRALGGYDEMVFRTKVFDHKPFYDVVGLESEGTTIDFQIGVNSYLYGTRFISYLVYHYGPEKLLIWYNRSEGSKRYFSSQFKNVYGASLDDEWAKWINWEHQWQNTNLEILGEYPFTSYRQIYPAALGSVSRPFYDSKNRLFYIGVNYPGQISHIASINRDTGEIKKICNMNSPALYYVTSLAYDPSINCLFFSTHNSSSFRDLNMVDLSTGKIKVLMKQSRIGDLVFNPGDKSIWGMQHHNGFSTLITLPPPYDNGYIVLKLDYGKDLFDLDISSDGKVLIGSLIEISGRQILIKMNIDDLLEGNTSWEELFEFTDNAPQNFVFSKDDKTLFGTSYYSGVSNVWQYDFETGDMNALTNCETGFFRPLPVSDDSLFVFRYAAEGFVPVMISNSIKEQVNAPIFLGDEVAEKYPIVTTWILDPPSPSRIDVDSLIIDSGNYSGIGSMKIASIYPVIEGFKDFPAYGLRINLRDDLGSDRLTFSASYTPNKVLPKDQRFHALFDYTHWNWSISGSYNGSDFYDLFGPTKISRKGYSLGIKYNGSLIYDKPKSMDYTLELTGYGGLEKLPEFQNIDVSFDKFFTFGAKLDYSYLLRSLGSVEYEQGITWQIRSKMNYVNSKLFPRLYSSFDVGFLLPLSHSSIWLRSSMGYSQGDRDEPFANFYFGGYGNNWIDYQGINRYRQYYSFPGIELNQTGGTNYGKFLVEWTLPPLRFRRFGIPSFYFRWTRLAFFTSTLITNIDSRQERRSLINLGVQLNTRLVTFSLLKSTLSLGVALAFEKHQRPSKEFMISFKVL